MSFAKSFRSITLEQPLRTDVSDFDSYREFHAFLDEIAERLTSEGFPEHARKLHSLLHEVAWTTSSELIGELGAALRAAKRETRGRASADLAKAIARGLREVRPIWPWLR